MIEALYQSGLGLIAAGWWSHFVWPIVWNLLKIVVVVAPLMGAVRTSAPAAGRTQ